MLSRPPVTALCLSVFMQVQPTLHEYIDWYKEDPDFQKTLAEVKLGRPSEFILHDGLLYKGKLLCIPRADERVRYIREAHTSKIAGHFRVTKTLQNLIRYIFLP